MRILVFARAPVAGQAKTRLIPALGAEGAARLHRRLVQRALATACAAGIGNVELWCAPDCDHPFFTDCALAYGCVLQAQPPGDLGARMRAALEAGLPALLLGSDAPGLEPGILRDAGRALASGSDCVLVPALDGGYVMIGLSVASPGLFDHMPWGSAEVLVETRRRCTGQSLRLAELRPCPDIDRPADLVHCPPELLRGLVRVEPG
jgi:uncharacterized protein